MRARIFLPALLVCVLIAFASGRSEAQAGLPAWDVVATPNAGHGDNQLNGVDALTSGEAWAVGNSGDYLNPAPLVERYDGAAWTIVETPATDAATLYAVKAIAAGDVWAVGGYQNTGKSLIEHWDGSAWSLAGHAEKGIFNQLYAVDGTSSSDVWAVGEFANGGVSSTLIQHWNGSAWSIVSSPNRGSGYNHLYGVVAIAPDDVWAVGQDGSSKSLTLHWNGTAWTAVSSPSDGRETTFRSVSALATNDVWAVGHALSGTITAHWDGSTWTLVPSPSPGLYYRRLQGVEAIAVDDVWAAGIFFSGSEYLTLVEHWDGTQWSIVDSPSVGDYSELFGVTGTGPTDVWVVGDADDGTLVAHWDGQSLSTAPSDNVGTGSNSLHGVQATGPTDVWTVGTTEQDTLTEHWDGSSFVIVPSPNVADRDNVLEGTDGTASADVWAVGHADVTGFIGSSSLIEHWNGSAWSIVASPNFGGTTDRNNLLDVAAITSRQAWAVGTFESTKAFKAIVLRWDGSRWRAVANPCGSGLSGIDARSASDIWAVGGADTCHWDGTKWTHFDAAPAPDGQSSINLLDVTVAGPNDAWAVGDEASTCGEGQICHSGVIQHWNGQKWSVVRFFGVGLEGVHAITASDIYAVGLGTGALAVHYDGQDWTSVPLPDLDPSYGDLKDVEATSSTDIWGAGEQAEGSSPKTLVMHAPSPTSGAVEGGTNVSGATVSWFGAETGSVETDPFGDYAVGGLTAGTYTFTATYAGCDPDTAQVQVIAGTTITQDFQLDC